MGDFGLAFHCRGYSRAVPLVEVVGGAKTSEATIERAMALGGESMSGNHLRRSRT